MSHRDQPARLARRRYLIDSRWQLTVTWVAAGTALLVSVLFLVAGHFLTASAFLDGLSSSQIGFMAIAINALYFVMMTAVFAVMTVRFTHTIAGPARVLRDAVEALRAGRFDGRLRLRKYDYLKDLAGSVGALSAELRERSVDQRRLLDELEAALARRDFSAAGQAVHTLRALAPDAGAEPLAVERSAA
jgi:hypothetical protein